MKNNEKKSEKGYVKQLLTHFSRSGYMGIVVIGIILIVAVGVVIGVSHVIGNSDPNIFVFATVINNITIMLISTIATLIGLYVTAFIFLNDSLKERVKEDPTIGDAVRSILALYRKNMVYIAIFAIVTIVWGVVVNLLHDSGASMESVKVALTGWRWSLFVFYSGVSIFVIIWIILCSRDITDSDALIYRYSVKNRDNFKHNIVKKYKAVSAPCDNDNQSYFPDDKWIDTYSGDMILDALYDKWYSLHDAYIKAKRDGDIIEIEGELTDEMFGRYEIELGKVVRLLENMIGRISDNNIDKSIMNNEYRNESLKNGFMWLFGRYSEDNEKEKGNAEEDKQKPDNNLIDVRDSKRFLDYIKYKIISDTTFEHRPFNNAEVERVFERVVMAFENREFGDDEDEFEQKGKRSLINEYKYNTGDVIREFFDGYNDVVGYRDAMIHLNRFVNKKGKRVRKRSERNSRKDKDIVNVLNYAIVLKRILLDRFMSFVRTDDLSLGNSTMNKGWFNYSELSDSNFTHSSFRYACMENAIMRNCDLSTCSFVMADASDTDFSRSNFSYSDLTGMDLTDAKLNGSQMNSVILRDQRIDLYDGLSALINVMEKGYVSAKDNVDNHAQIRNNNQQRSDWRIRVRTAAQSAAQDNCDENELNKVQLRKLRNAEYLRKLAITVLDRFNNELVNLEEQGTTNVNILLYDRDAQFNGLSVLNESYDYLMGGGAMLSDNMKAAPAVLEEYVNYRKYSKIDKLLFDNFDKYRKVEEKSKTNKGKNCKKARESTYGKVYFRVAVLQSASINGVSMPGTDFSFVNMKSASFRDSDLSGSDMYNTNAQNAMFTQTNLTSLDAYKTVFDEANFTTANLIGANFVDCSLNSTNFKKALLLNSKFVKTREACKAEEENDQGENIPIYLLRILRAKTLDSDGQNPALRVLAEIENARMISEIKNFDKESMVSCFDADFSGAIASRMIMLNLNMLRSQFVKTDMSSAFLYNLVLMYGDLTEANLSNAIVMGCAFHQADCYKIDLQKAIIYACEFTNANVSESTINAAILSRCIFEQTNLNKGNFTRSKVNNCSFVNCSFKGINLAGTRFNNCIFCDIDFSEAIGLTDAEFANCAFQTNNSTVSEAQIKLTEKINKGDVVVCSYDEGNISSAPRYSTNKKVE